MTSSLVTLLAVRDSLIAFGSLQSRTRWFGVGKCSFTSASLICRSIFCLFFLEGVHLSVYCPLTHCSCSNATAATGTKRDCSCHRKSDMSHTNQESSGYDLSTNRCSCGSSIHCKAFGYFFLNIVYTAISDPLTINYTTLVES